MTIDSSVRRAGPFAGNGSTDAFPFGFKIFRRDDIRVTLADADDVETILQLDSDYVVSVNPDQAQAPGGLVTYPVTGAPMPVGYRLTLSGALSYEQPTSITNQGGFYPKVLEDALDRATIQIQQLAEQLSRSLQVPISGGLTTDELIARLEAQLAMVNAVYLELDSIRAVASNEADIGTVADNVGAVVSVAGDLGGTWASGVAYDFGYVMDPPVGNTSPPGGNIVVVSNSIDNVNIAADNIDVINTIGNLAPEVKVVADNMPTVQAVASNKTNIDAAVANEVNINAAVANEANITAVADNGLNINAAVGNASNINAAVGNASNINAAVANEVNINVVATDIGNVNTMAALSADIQTVSGISTDVTNVADNEDAVVAVGSDLMGQPIVIDYGDLTPATNPAAPSGVLGAVWANAANIAAVAGEIAAVVYVSTHLSEILDALAGALITTNNLSDLDDPATARANLGLADLGGIT